MKFNVLILKTILTLTQLFKYSQCLSIPKLDSHTRIKRIDSEQDKGNYIFWLFIVLYVCSKQLVT